MFLRQSTASQEILLGPFLDPADGDTEVTSLTIANTDVKLFKAGASAQVNKNSGGATHDAGGMYVATLDATDTNTVGPLQIKVHVAGALYVKDRFTVLTAAVYDALIAGSATLDVGLFDELPDDIPDTATRPSIAQSAYGTFQALTNAGTIGTVLRVRKPGGAKLFDCTLDDADSPSDVQRADPTP
jgi:hypothetical protein